jgi:hypothetical protein
MVTPGGIRAKHRRLTAVNGGSRTAIQIIFSNLKGGDMATGETGFDDVTFDLISVQYHSLKAGHDYGQYVRDAKNAGLDDVASFFDEVMAQDSERARRCHEFLGQLQRSSASS